MVYFPILRKLIIKPTLPFKAFRHWNIKAGKLFVTPKNSIEKRCRYHKQNSGILRKTRERFRSSGSKITNLEANVLNLVGIWPLNKMDKNRTCTAVKMYNEGRFYYYTREHNGTIGNNMNNVFGKKMKKKKKITVKLGDEPMPTITPLKLDLKLEEKVVVDPTIPEYTLQQPGMTEENKIQAADCNAESKAEKTKGEETQDVKKDAGKEPMVEKPK